MLVAADNAVARANEGDVVTVYDDEHRGRTSVKKSSAAQKLVFDDDDNKENLPDVVGGGGMLSEDEDDDVGEAADKSAEIARAKANAKAQRRLSPRQNRRAPDYYEAV